MKTRGEPCHSQSDFPSFAVSEGLFPSSGFVALLVALLFAASVISLSTGLNGLLLNTFPFAPGTGVTILGTAPPPDPPLRFLSKKYASREDGDAVRGGVTTDRY